MENKNILISGAGIAGLTLAHWLKKFGFNPVIVEKSPVLREGGYVIDFFGAGYDVAEKMDILDGLRQKEILIDELTFVDENNKRLGGLDIAQMKKVVKNRIFNIRRSDLARVIFEHLDKDIPFLFGNAIQKIEQHGTGVQATFESGEEQQYDLVIGADGLHSRVRQLAFGPDSAFESFYGYYASSYTIRNYLHFTDQISCYSEPGKQSTVYVLDQDTLIAFFIFSQKEKLAYEHHDVARQKAILRERFGQMPWECPALLEMMDEAPDFYFDSVSQVKMDQWSKGRVSLVGDACDCPSLLSGQGCTLAMVGAYILAGELHEARGDFNTAFPRYEAAFRPFIEKKQKLAQSFAGSFVPQSKFGIWMRNKFTFLLFAPLFSNWFVNRFLVDHISLMDYEK